MQKNSTLISLRPRTPLCIKKSISAAVEAYPKASTLNLLSQFARAYSPIAGGLVIN